jgi:hypothetical protein
MALFKVGEVVRTTIRRPAALGGPMHATESAEVGSPGAALEGGGAAAGGTAISFVGPARRESVIVGLAAA